MGDEDKKPGTDYLFLEQINKCLPVVDEAINTLTELDTAGEFKPIGTEMSAQTTAEEQRIVAAAISVAWTLRLADHYKQENTSQDLQTRAKEAYAKVTNALATHSVELAGYVSYFLYVIAYEDENVLSNDSNFELQPLSQELREASLSYIIQSVKKAAQRQQDNAPAFNMLNQLMERACEYMDFMGISNIQEQMDNPRGMGSSYINVKELIYIYKELKETARENSYVSSALSPLTIKLKSIYTEHAEICKLFGYEPSVDNPFVDEEK